MKSLFGRSGDSPLRQAAVEFTLAMALFWTLALAMSSYHGRAHAVPLHAAGALVQAGAERTSGPALFTVRTHTNRPSPPGDYRSLGLLSFALAFLAALNLGIWRHLRRAYASPRRGVWRRG